MKRKVWNITVKDNPNRAAMVMGENDEFYTRDTEAYLVFKLDDKNFNPATAVLTLENRNDGSLKNETVDVVDGLIEWEMPQRYIEHFGNWQGQLVYEDTKDGQPELYTSAPFSFVVNAHIGDKKKPSLVEIENWEKFIREGTELIETWEDLEALREENERQRQANYQELLDTGVLQTNINTKLEQLEEEYAPKLTEVTAQLAQTDSKVDTKIDKNGAQQVKWANIAQDAREQISGDKVAVVGKDSVGSDNVITNSIGNTEIKQNDLDIDVLKDVYYKDKIEFTFVDGHLTEQGNITLPGRFMHTPEFISIDPQKSYIFKSNIENIRVKVYFYNDLGVVLDTTLNIRNGTVIRDFIEGTTKIKFTTYTEIYGETHDLNTVAYLTTSQPVLNREIIPPVDFSVSYWGQHSDPDFDHNKRTLTFDSVGGIWKNNRFTPLSLPKDEYGNTIPYVIPYPERMTSNSLAVILVRKNITDDTQIENNIKIEHFSDVGNSYEWVTIGLFNRRGYVLFNSSFTVNGNPYGIETTNFPDLPSYDEEVYKRQIVQSTKNEPVLTIERDKTSVYNTEFYGSNNPDYSNESGIYTIGLQFNQLQNLLFENFKGKAGLTVGNTVGTHSTLTGNNLVFLNNKIGFLSEVRGEYVSISNSQFNGNEVGARIHGGNVQLSSSIITGNTVGIEILGGSNDSHGIISDCQVNHNKGKALVIDGITNGHTITGSHFYDAVIEIKNVTNKPVRFDNCVFGGRFTMQDNVKVIFNNCFFPSGYGLTNSVIENTTIEGSNNEVEESTMEQIFNTQ